jgi:hypothetical protein
VQQELGKLLLQKVGDSLSSAELLTQSVLPTETGQLR